MAGCQTLTNDVGCEQASLNLFSEARHPLAPFKPTIHTPIDMLARAFARSARLTRPTIMRRGGGGAPEVNEPGGYLFNEKVFSHSTNATLNTHTPRRQLIY